MAGKITSAEIKSEPTRFIASTIMTAMTTAAASQPSHSTIDVLSFSSDVENLTPADIAERMGVSVERVLELMEIRRSASVTSLDAEIKEDEEDTLEKFVGVQDRGFEDAVNRDFVRKAMEKLEEQERKIIFLRFWKNLSQKQVADILGISQMTVSRSERKALAKMNNELNAD